MWAAYPPSWLRFLVERWRCSGHSAGFRIECPEILSSPVRHWVSVSWAAPFQFLPDLRLHGLWRSVREFRDGDYGGVSQGLRG